jgi:para-aminobenzoate synthetase component 1
LDNQQALIEKVNESGRQRVPFLLLVDFLGINPQFFLLDQLKQEHIDIDFPNYSTLKKSATQPSIKLKKHVADFTTYKHKLDIVKHHIARGNTFLTNLTCETPIDCEASLDAIYSSAIAKYKIRYKDEWVCFSPETFIQTEGRTIRSFPMKGTIDASIPHAEQTLLLDEKEIAEHYTIVDLIRNDLSMVSTDVTVKRFRYIDTITSSAKTLLQVSSQIEGQLPDNYLDHLGTMLFTLLPAGSISGAPKKKTLDIIQEAEGYERGFYTGTAFYFDGTNIDSCVLIRFIEKKQTASGKQLVYKSGGGITFHSDAEKEFQELSDKIYVPSF